jgi:hypothetical protein
MEQLSNRRMTGPETTHPALVAWERLGGKIARRARIEIIKNEKKSVLCRLSGLEGIGDASLIAKRAWSGGVEREAIVYRDILAKLPVSAVRFYGSTADDDPEYTWLFIEDVGSEPCVADNLEHRELAARWLAVMNTTARQNQSAQLLPVRGAEWYLARLSAGRERILQAFSNAALNPQDQQVLRAILQRYEAIELRWAELAAFCENMPKTLVHGDFSPKNIRVRRNGQVLELFPLDWETAGWGAPAADLSDDIEITTYHSHVRETWTHVSLEEWRRLRQCGRLFRIIAAIEWASVGLQHSWVVKPVSYLATYNDWLAESFIGLGWSKSA